MTEITTRSDIGITEIQHCGSDAMVVAAARVSTKGLVAFDPEMQQHSMILKRGSDLDARDAGLIDFLMREGHTSPFEHNSLTVAVEAPIFVAREWMRHRTQSFNEESGRYRELKPVFYFTGCDRPTIQVGKPGAYSFELDDSTQFTAQTSQRYVAKVVWDEYRRQLDLGVAREVARMVLPLSIYTSFYATANLLNWLKFLKLRNDDQAMYEIREGAVEVEKIIARLWPTCYSAWYLNGRRI